ncbi:LytTR family DNA-binding domain-containing protein [Spirosoma soli]|uniref:LytTR family DNA-binding domain-containing protein n=1 Tax=Spirosoma soli TaxID=1770529 RepID=A0ABW5LWW6_9BACT
MTRKRWIQLVGAVFTAVFLVTFDNVPLVDLLQKPTYYRDLSLTFIASFLLFSYVSFITSQLDRRPGWAGSGLWRLTAQGVLGVVGASALAYGMAYAQYRFVDREHVFGTDSFLQVELPVMVLCLLFVNSLYVGGSYFRWREQSQIRPYQEQPSPPETSYVTTVIGIHGHKRINVPTDNIAFICVENGITWLFTFDNARYHLDEPLHQLMERLNPTQFFRVNRQYIVQLSACFSYEPADFSKLTLRLIPPFNLELTISQKTAAGFRRWIERQPAAD